jgi:transposase
MSGLSITKYFPFTRVKIIKQNVHYKDASSAIVFIDQDKRYKPLCHECGSEAATVHSKNHNRLIRDLNMANAEVFLQVNYRKIWCDTCGGVRVEHMTFADAGQHVTNRMARYIHELCKKLTVKDVAEHLHIDPKTVKEIDKSFLEESFGQGNFDDLRVLMIDEIAVHKGHSYMTVVADFFTGRVVWMGRNRDKQALDGFFKNLTDSQKQAIEAVAMDMWEPYINRVKHYCPHAKIVFDFFHVVQSFSKVIDYVRRTEYLRAKGKHREVLKGSRYLLLKNDENLNDQQRNRLAVLLEFNRTLGSIYILKDQLKLLYYYSDREQVRKALDDWCIMAEQIDHPTVRAFAKRLRFFAYGIINHADYPIGTSMLEGINNKIKVIKRKAYGFHDDFYFMLKVKQACVA